MWRDWTRAGHRAFEALARLRAPLIAALTGHAFGGGLELAAVADIRVAESGVRLGLPEAGLGMAPGWSGTQRLVRRFGASPVRRMALAGRMFTRRGGAGARTRRRSDAAGPGPCARPRDRGRHRAARTGRGADHQGDDQRRRGRGSRRADRGAGGRAARPRPRTSPRGSPRSAKSARRPSPDDRSRHGRALQPDAGPKLGRNAMKDYSKKRMFRPDDCARTGGSRGAWPRGLRIGSRQAASRDGAGPHPAGE